MIDTRDLTPLDFQILERLPDEGSMVMGAYPDGRTLKDLQKTLFEGKIKTSIFVNRAMILGKAGFVVRLKGVGTSGAAIYQRTLKGKKVHETWKRNQPQESQHGHSDESQ